MDEIFVIAFYYCLNVGEILHMYVKRGHKHILLLYLSGLNLQKHLKACTFVWFLKQKLRSVTFLLLALG